MRAVDTGSILPHTLAPHEWSLTCFLSSVVLWCLPVDLPCRFLHIKKSYPYFNTDAQTWFCDDFQPPPPDPSQIIDYCFIHPGCDVGVQFINGAWRCNDDLVSTQYGDTWYVG